MIAAAEAGADVVDCACDSMSGMTSQPSMGSLLNAFKGTDLDTGLDAERVLRLSAYWEQVRAQYGQFESGMRSGSSEVYEHEMPGGQYTNLKFQAMQNGLVEQWEEVKGAYRMGNKILGDIVKVTPSSKVVGDLAQFIVQNKLTEDSIVDLAPKLDFPQSVVEYFQGYPFCGTCMTGVIQEFAEYQNGLSREQWRRSLAGQLAAWRSRATEALGLSATGRYHRRSGGHCDGSGVLPGPGRREGRHRRFVVRWTFCTGGYRATAAAGSA